MTHFDEQAQEIRDRLPEPGVTPLEHLRHALAAHASTPGDQIAVQATAGIYGRTVVTGLTFGDLRALLVELDQRAVS